MQLMETTKVNLPQLSEQLISEMEKKQVMKQHMRVFYQKYPWLKEVYQGSPEKEFDRLFDNAVTNIEDQLKLTPRTRNRIALLMKRVEFLDEIIPLVKQFR